MSFISTKSILDFSIIIAIFIACIVIILFLPTDAFPTEMGLLRALSGTGDSAGLYPGSFTLSYCTYFPLESSTKSDDSELTCFTIIKK